MTDRELLELSAKAAGYTLGHGDIDGFPYFCLGGRVWNPLDITTGDALRLAIDLGIRIDFAKGWTVAYSGSCASEQFSERHEDNPYAATCRAIVRAAAEIGQSMS